MDVRPVAPSLCQSARVRIPGYQGHVPGKGNHAQAFIPPKRRHSVGSTTPSEHGLVSKTASRALGGYGGHVPGLKTEQVFGVTKSKSHKLSVQERSGTIDLSKSLPNTRLGSTLDRSNSGLCSESCPDLGLVPGYQGHLRGWRIGHVVGESLHQSQARRRDGSQTARETTSSSYGNSSSPSCSPPGKTARRGSESSRRGSLTARSTGTTTASEKEYVSKKASRAPKGYGGHVPGLKTEGVCGVSSARGHKLAVAARSGSGTLDNLTSSLNINRSMSDSRLLVQVPGYQGHVPGKKFEALHTARSARTKTA